MLICYIKIKIGVFLEKGKGGMGNRKSTYNKGFTLVELSIVLVIIALIITGVAAGSSLLKQAKLNAVISESTNYRQAIQTFKIKHGYFPGDFPNAAAFWPSSDPQNGNGNGLIDYGSWGGEDLYLWNHLSLSGLLPYNYNGNCIGWTCYSFGINAPGSSYSPYTGYMGAYYSQVYNNVGINTLVFGAPNDGAGNGLNWGGMVPADASSIDSKVDDGNAGTGQVLASTGYGGSGCTNIGWFNVGSAVGSVTYTLTDTNPNCMVYFVLQ